MVVLRRPGPGPARASDVLPPRFAPAVRAARQQLRLTQKELSDKLAAAGTPTPVQLVSAWENGHHEPSSVDTVYALEEALDLPEGTLLLRLRGSSPEARDLYARFSPESLCYATTMVTEHVHVGPSGAVECIEVSRRIRALQPTATCFVVVAQNDARHRIRIVPRSGCTAGNCRPLMRDRIEMRLELDSPMKAGEEQIVRYETQHTYFGGQTVHDREHRHNGTHMHTLIAITVSFAVSGARVVWSTVHGPGEIVREPPQDLRGRRSATKRWPYPGAVGCVVSWELPA